MDQDKPKSQRHSEMDRSILAVLVCPVSGGPLELSPSGNELLSFSARLAFPVHDGIPLMLPSEARQLTAGELGRKRRK